MRFAKNLVLTAKKSRFKVFTVIICLLPQLTTGSPVEATTQQDWSRWELRVGSLNVWALKYVSKFTSERMPRIGTTIRDRQLDHVLLQEAWTESARQLIQVNSGLPYYHYFHWPRTVGSGLYDLSKFPIRPVYFQPFTMNGSIRRIWEGEIFAGKGASLTEVNAHGLLINFINTHAVARHSDTPSDTVEDKYTPERMMQYFEVMQTVIERRTSDAFIVAGDFNSRLTHHDYHFWKTLSSLEGIQIEDVGSPICTACPNIYRPSHINGGQLDYIHVSPRLKLSQFNLDFAEPFDSKSGRKLYLSDHFGFVAKIRVNEAPPKGLSQRVCQRFQSALVYLESRLVEHLGKTFNPPEIELPEVFKGIQDRFCKSCRIKDSLMKVRYYQYALSEMPSTDDKILNLRKQIKSYCSLFD
ncbi:MAG: hypothetical protein IT289_03270 [Oligoflexia bacterium]|nr:hypothetical protein [Oligoflexia bacterium]